MMRIYISVGFQHLSITIIKFSLLDNIIIEKKLNKLKNLQHCIATLLQHINIYPNK